MGVRSMRALTEAPPKRVERGDNMITLSSATWHAGLSRQAARFGLDACRLLPNGVVRIVPMTLFLLDYSHAVHVTPFLLFSTSRKPTLIYYVNSVRAY
ncbi:hypothetical protein ACOSP7_002330 [Xanthoceras sorbifolium]